MADNIEIEQISNSEYLVEENKIYLLDNNIIHVVAVGEQSDELAMAHVEIFNRLTKWNEGKFNYLIDLNKAGKNSTEARKLWKDISEDENTGKLALFGLHSVARVLASIVIGVNSKNKDHHRFFKLKEEAFKWLNQAK